MFAGLSRGGRSWLVVVVALGGVLVAVAVVFSLSERSCGTEGDVERPARRLSSGIRSFDEFLGLTPPSTRAFLRIERDGKILIGAHSKVRSLGSGPTVYVFDASKRIVDWTADVGDDPCFDQRWGWTRSIPISDQSFPISRISLSEAENIFAATPK